jgi:hypothetical protein
MREGNAKDPTEEAIVVRDTMRALAPFAKDPWNGLVRLGWPVCGPTSEYVGSESKMGS